MAFTYIARVICEEKDARERANTITEGNLQTTVALLALIRVTQVILETL